MKKLVDGLAAASVLLAVICIVSRILGPHIINLGFMKINTGTGLGVAIFLLQLSTWIKLSAKE